MILEINSLGEAAFSAIFTGCLTLILWETYKIARRYNESKKYTWMSFDTPEEAQRAADLVQRHLKESILDGDQYVEFAVKWTPAYEASGHGKSSVPRIQVRVPWTLLNELTENQKYTISTARFREMVKANEGR